MCNSQQKCHIELLEDKSCPASSKYLQMVYSCEQKVCLDSLGIADGSVADYSFKASSMEDATPEKTRLNGESCWKPSRNPLGSWILVNLGYTRKVTAIVTQGCNSTDTRSWDIPLEMRLSVDRKKWTKHPDGKFIGGGIHLLETPAFAQYVRILPLENRPEFGLCFDIFGCPHEDAMTCARTFNSLHLTLVWSDHHEVTFTHWAAGEPIQRVGLDQHCVAVLRETGRWKRMSCAQVNSFMCKMPTAHFPIAVSVSNGPRAQGED